MSLVSGSSWEAAGEWLGLFAHHSATWIFPVRIWSLLIFESPLIREINSHQTQELIFVSVVVSLPLLSRVPDTERDILGGRSTITAKGLSGHLQGFALSMEAGPAFYLRRVCVEPLRSPALVFSTKQAYVQGFENVEWLECVNM